MCLYLHDHALRNAERVINLAEVDLEPLDVGLEVGQRGTLQHRQVAGQRGHVLGEALFDVWLVGKALCGKSHHTQPFKFILGIFW